VLKGIPLRGVGEIPVEGDVLLWDGPISFLGDVDPSTGMMERDGMVMDLKDSILFFREGAGSTVGSYVVYNLKLNGKAPRSMIMIKADAIISIGCILADIPLIHRIDPVEWGKIKTGDRARVDPATGNIDIWSRTQAR
jgi:predicted aconitase with swiveling domain